MNGEDKAREIQSLVPTPAPQQVVQHHYTKSNLFRTIYVDGVYGGPTLTASNIQMAVFTQRFPFPERTSTPVTGGVDIFEKRIIKDGLERELEVSLVMSLDTAKSIVGWLNDRINTVETNLRQKK